MFSIIIPTLNEEKYLPRLLDSLIQQTEKDFEVIVVDGASKDRTVAKARAFKRKLPGLTVTVSKKASLPLQRNMGAHMARGDWFVFVDADGELLPYFIERAKYFIKSQKPALFAVWFRPDSETPGDALLTLFGNLVLEASILFRRPQVTPGQLSVVSRKAFDAVGGYDESHAFTEDLDLSLRLDKAGFKPTILREVLCRYSLRRLRKEGTIKVLQSYAKAAVAALFTRSAPKSMPGYLMGGHLYGKGRPIKQSAWKGYERKLKKLTRELFG